MTHRPTNQPMDRPGHEEARSCGTLLCCKCAGTDVKMWGNKEEGGRRVGGRETGRRSVTEKLKQTKFFFQKEPAIPFQFSQNFCTAIRTLIGNFKIQMIILPWGRFSYLKLPSKTPQLPCKIPGHTAFVIYIDPHWKRLGLSICFTFHFHFHG